MTTTQALLFAGFGLFWAGMLGLLWRRSLVGMLVGVLFGWLSVVLVMASWLAEGAQLVSNARGVAVVFCVTLVAAIQVVIGLAIVVSRVSRSGSLDADDAGLLEG